MLDNVASEQAASSFCENREHSPVVFEDARHHFPPAFFQSAKVHGFGILKNAGQGETRKTAGSEQASKESGEFAGNNDITHGNRWPIAKRHQADTALLLPVEPGASYEQRHMPMVDS